jgi:hypothetical protein
MPWSHRNDTTGRRDLLIINTQSLPAVAEGLTSFQQRIDDFFGIPKIAISSSEFGGKFAAKGQTFSGSFDPRRENRNRHNACGN